MSQSPSNLRPAQARWTAPLLSALLVLLALVSSPALVPLHALAEPAAESAGPEKPSILLLPVMVNSSESRDYLRRGLADMLSSRFEQAGEFSVTRDDDATHGTTQIARALELGRAAGVDFVLFGSFTRFGAGASLDMQAVATADGAEGETYREIFVHSGSIGDVIPDLEDLVGKVTRFAIRDYRGPMAAPAQAASGQGDALEALRRRVRALEEAVAALQGGSPAAR